MKINRIESDSEKMQAICDGVRFVLDRILGDESGFILAYTVNDDSALEVVTNFNKNEHDRLFFYLNEIVKDNEKNYEQKK